jgi:hypothetical protein
MTDNINQSDHRITRRARSIELVLIWILAIGGSILGSLIIAILGYVLAKVNYPTKTSEWSAELLGAALGMGLSIPVGVVGGGLVGTGIATLSVYVNSWRTTLIASIIALVVGVLVSGVALVPIGFIIWLMEHI